MMVKIPEVVPQLKIYRVCWRLGVALHRNLLPRQGVNTKGQQRV